MKKAEITAFLSLIFILLVTFISSVIDVTSLQVAKNYRRMDAQRAIECVFAEYQRELLEEYDIFALDGGYESGAYAENLIDERLKYYGLVNSENTIESIQFLSDNNAEPFYQQACQYVEHRYGLEFIKENLEMTGIWEDQEEASKEYQKEETQNENILEELLQENELPVDDNPISAVEGLKRISILELVMPEGKSVSEKAIPVGELASCRELNKGYGSFSSQGQADGTVGKLLFGEYLLGHFSSAVDEPEHVLDYEMEYILAGKGSDRENLKAVVGKLLAIRLVSNYTYLQGNAQKKAEAEALAFTLCAAITVPQATEAVAQGILLAWAFQESIADIRSLLNGEKVPLLKDGGDGLGYEGYLRILLFLEKKETIAMRSLDLIEQNLKKIHGQEFFQVDSCVTKLEAECTCSFRRGITYTFPLCFEYQ